MHKQICKYVNKFLDVYMAEKSSVTNPTASQLAFQVRFLQMRHSRSVAKVCEDLSVHLCLKSLQPPGILISNRFMTHSCTQLSLEESRKE